MKTSEKLKESLKGALTVIIVMTASCYLTNRLFNNGVKNFFVSHPYFKVDDCLYNIPVPPKETFMKPDPSVFEFKVEAIGKDAYLLRTANGILRDSPTMSSYTEFWYIDRFYVKGECPLSNTKGN